MVEISRDGRRVYFTNSLYAAWDEVFYPDGVGAWAARIDVDTDTGGMKVDPRFFPHGDDFRGLRVHQTRLQGGDARATRTASSTSAVPVVAADLVEPLIGAVGAVVVAVVGGLVTVYAPGWKSKRDQRREVAELVSRYRQSLLTGADALQSRLYNIAMLDFLSGYWVEDRFYAETSTLWLLGAVFRLGGDFSPRGRPRPRR